MYMHHYVIMINRHLPLLAFCLLGFIWGTNFLFMKEAVAIISPLQVVLLRVIFGSLPILVFAFLKRALSLRDFRSSHHFIAMALFANVLPYYFFVKGTQLLASGIAGVISGTIPLMTAVIVVFTLPEERLNWRKTIGLVFGFSGVVLVANLSSGSQSSQWLGALYIVMGAVSYSIAMVYAKKFVGPLKMSSLQLASYQTLFSSFMLAAVTPYSGIEAIFSEPKPLLGLIIGLGLFGTGCAFVMYYYIIERLGAITASSVYYIPPLVALLIGATVRGEVITFMQACGTITIIAGIYLARSGAINATRK